MAYIGNEPVIGQWRKLDDISGGFNGSETNFTTQVGGANVTAGSANQLLVSLGGVLQEPGTDYSVSSSTITFTTAPAASLSFFAVLAGDALSANTPSDGSVTTAKLGSNLTVDLDLGSAASPSLTFDADSGLFSGGDNQVAVSTSGVERVEFGASEVVFNDGGANYDFRVEGDTDANLLFVDASTDRVGIGTNSPSAPLVVNHTSTSGTDQDVVRFETQSGGDLKIQASDLSSANPAWKIYTPGNEEITLGANNGEAIHIDGSNNVGIGTTTTSRGPLHLHQDGTTNTYLKITNGVTGSAAADGAEIVVNTSGEFLFNNRETQPILFLTQANERARIDSSGRLLVGTNSDRDQYNNTTGQGPRVQIETIAGEPSNALGLVRNSNNTAGSRIVLAKSRGTTAGSATVVNNGDSIGIIEFQAADGTDLVPAANIIAEVDDTPGANDMPGRLMFSTTADGTDSPTERMTIKNDGEVQIGYNNSSNRSFLYIKTTSNTVGYFDRLTTDGTVIQIRQDGTQEGTISVSGTTVSYNGGHLARWSQLPGGAARTEILRGSVLSNINEMCEWGEEENEQLNRMKVSDVEGDKNVSGVFQAWDDDDDTYTNDFYCAMTGDFIIRIAQGVTVERGDLLMSAGDGTAKPQGDGFVQDKTIAKVTSTNVSCTYDDGSYCVPCVLMAC